MDDDPPSRIEIAVSRISGTLIAKADLLRTVIRAALERHGVQRGSVSVALVDDPHMARLHGAHLGKNRTTDVLAFNLLEPSSEKGVADRAVDGEIVISTETAIRESALRGHSPEAELALYAVHGALHLLGHDDRTSTDAARMHALEDEILTTAGLGSVFSTSRPVDSGDSS